MSSKETPAIPSAYLLRRQGLGKTPEVRLTKSEFLRLISAHECLRSALAIEEIYEITISHYAEIENALLTAASGQMIRREFSYPFAFQLRTNMNIRLMSLLSSIRLYSDQLPGAARKCLPGVPGIRNQVKELLLTKLKKSRENRLMHELRNHVQHRGLPIHWTNLPASWTDGPPKGQLEFSVNIGLNRERLREDQSFSPDVLDEFGERIDLKTAVRAHLESLSEVHEVIREKIKGPIAIAREEIVSARNRYREVWDGSLLGLEACEHKGRRAINSIPLMLDWDDIRIQLQRKNGPLINLKKRYVSSRLEKQS